MSHSCWDLQESVVGLPWAQTGPLPFWTCRPLALSPLASDTQSPARLPVSASPVAGGSSHPAFRTPVQRVPWEPLLFSKA